RAHHWGVDWSLHSGVFSTPSRLREDNRKSPMPRERKTSYFRTAFHSAWLKVTDNRWAGGLGSTYKSSVSYLAARTTRRIQSLFGMSPVSPFVLSSLASASKSRMSISTLPPGNLTSAKVMPDSLKFCWTYRLPGATSSTNPLGSVALVGLLPT